MSVVIHWKITLAIGSSLNNSHHSSSKIRIGEFCPKEKLVIKAYSELLNDSHPNVFPSVFGRQRFQYVACLKKKQSVQFITWFSTIGFHVSYPFGRLLIPCTLRPCKAICLNWSWITTNFVSWRTAWFFQFEDDNGTSTWVLKVKTSILWTQLSLSRYLNRKLHGEISGASCHVAVRNGHVVSEVAMISETVESTSEWENCCWKRREPGAWKSPRHWRSVITAAWVSLGKVTGCGLGWESEDNDEFETVFDQLFPLQSSMRRSVPRLNTSVFHVSSSRKVFHLSV